MDKHWDKQYRDGGSISSDRRFTEWDFNKLIASDKFRAVWSGNLWEIIEEGKTTVLGKFNPKTKSLYISGDKNMDNFLVVWMTENGFVNSDEYAILENGGGVESVNKISKTYELRLDYKIGQVFEQDKLGGKYLSKILDMTFSVNKNGEVNNNSYYITYLDGNSNSKERTHYSFLKYLKKEPNIVRINVPYSIGSTIYYESSQYSDKLRLLSSVVESFDFLRHGSMVGWFDYRFEKTKGDSNTFVDSKDAYSGIENYMNRVLSRLTDNSPSSLKKLKNFVEPTGGNVKVVLDYYIGQKFKLPIMGGYGNAEITELNYRFDKDKTNNEKSIIKYIDAGGIEREQQLNYFIEDIKQQKPNEVIVPVKALINEDLLILHRYMGGSKLEITQVSSYVLMLNNSGIKLRYCVSDGCYNEEDVYTSVNDFKEKITESYANGGGVSNSDWNPDYCKCIKDIRFKDSLNFFEGFEYTYDEHQNSIRVYYMDGRGVTMSKETFDKHFEKIGKDKDKLTYANGGGVERIDLFEDYENIPQNVQTILDIYAEKFGDDFGDMDYKDMADMHNEIYAVGYTFDSYLDNQPYGLRPIGVSLNELKGYEDMGEEYANGGGVEYYKNSTIRKGTFGDDDFNPMDLPVTYRVYDENGKVVGKTTSFNNSGAIAYKLGYKAKIVATDKSGNERVIQDGVSKGEQFAGGGISKKSVISELKKLGYSNDNAEEIIEKHIDIYEINFDDKDTNARGIALAIDEQENQQDDYANGGGIKGKELWFSPYGEVKAEKRGTAKDYIEKHLAKSFGAEYMELVGEDDKDYIYELNGNPMMIAAKTAILQEETDLDIETYGRKKRVHIPKKSIDETSVHLRYPLITPFKNGGGVRGVKFNGLEFELLDIWKFEQTWDVKDKEFIDSWVGGKVPEEPKTLFELDDNDENALVNFVKSKGVNVKYKTKSWDKHLLSPFIENLSQLSEIFDGDLKGGLWYYDIYEDLGDDDSLGYDSRCQIYYLKLIGVRNSGNLHFEEYGFAFRYEKGCEIIGEVCDFVNDINGYSDFPQYLNKKGISEEDYANGGGVKSSGYDRHNYSLVSGAFFKYKENYEKAFEIWNLEKPKIKEFIENNGGWNIAFSSMGIKERPKDNWMQDPFINLVVSFNIDGENKIAKDNIIDYLSDIGKNKIGDMYWDYVNSKYYHYANGGGVGHNKVGEYKVEEDIIRISKETGTSVKDVIVLLNAMIDAKLTDKDLIPRVYVTEDMKQKAQEIWETIKPKYKGDLGGFQYPSTIKYLVSWNYNFKNLLERIKRLGSLKMNDEIDEKYKTLKKYLLDNKSWFKDETNYSNENNHTIVLTTRENGDIYNGTPSKKDFLEAKKILDIVKSKFDILGDIDYADETVILTITLKNKYANGGGVGEEIEYILLPNKFFIICMEKINFLFK